jgi:hypothetical protein
VSSKFVLTDDERNALMEQVYGGYVRNPATVSGNKATQGQRAPHRNAGQIDYGAYGGSASDDFMDQRYENYRNSKYYDPDRKTTFKRDGYGERWRNRDTWSKVADHLGIKDVDSETDLRQMYDFVQGIGKEEKDDDKPEYKPTPLPEDPYAGGGDDRPGIGRPGFGGNKGNVPGSIQYNPPSDDSELGRAISSVADYGNRGTDDYFGRFLPEMGQRNVNEAKATGRSLLSNIQKFQGKVPELGDPKDLFEFYLGKIKD